MKNILYITYQFPPDLSSNSIRNFEVVNHLASKFNIFVVTTKVRHQDEEQDSHLRRLRGNVNLFRLNFGKLHRMYKKDSQPNTVNDKKNFASKIKRCVHSYRNKFLVPDPTIDWYWIAKREVLNICVNNKIDYIISSATPYTSHLVGYSCSKQLKIPLILYYGDPWVYEQSRQRGSIRFIIEKKMESSILRHASRVYTVTETTRALYIEKFGLNPSVIDCMRSGFNPSDYQYAASAGNSKLTMLYGGTLNPIHRNPIPFLNALASLEADIKTDLRFELYSNETEKYTQIVKDKDLESVVLVKPLVVYQEFVKQLEKKDLLILFGNSSPLQVPGKVYDYIGSLSKILLINNSKAYMDDPTYKTIMSYQGNFFCQNEEAEIVSRLIQIHRLWKNNALGKNKYGDVKQFTWEASLSRLIEYIEQN